MLEDDANEIGEEEKGRLNDVDYLTGNPLPNDILLYSVPVRGPYSAVQTYKYRIKIIPGTAKKGKAAKTAMNLFSHMPEASSREKELMKACTDHRQCEDHGSWSYSIEAEAKEKQEEQQRGKRRNHGWKRCGSK